MYIAIWTFLSSLVLIFNKYNYDCLFLGKMPDSLDSFVRDQQKYDDRDHSPSGGAKIAYLDDRKVEGKRYVLLLEVLCYCLT